MRILSSTGPYFVAGEYFRSNLREDQEGVPIWLDIEGEEGRRGLYAYS